MIKIKPNIVFVLMLLLGLTMFFYPTASYLYSAKHNSKVVATYNRQVLHLSLIDYQMVIDKAKKYNDNLYHDRYNFFSKNWKKTYENEIKIGQSGVMGYIDISDVNIHLPIYHGSDESVLQIGAGHLEYSSLPVGGKNTHCVLSAHTGLPSARMFDDIHKLTKGSTFVIHVLKKNLTYQVDQIKIVNPNQVRDIRIIKDKDLCTLVTCTPMGLNNKRLLVRGHRIKQSKIKKKNISYIETIPTYAYIALAILSITIVGGVAYKKKNCCTY